MDLPPRRASNPGPHFAEAADEPDSGRVLLPVPELDILFCENNFVILMIRQS
jgi:hypothetical protein